MSETNLLLLLLVAMLIICIITMVLYYYLNFWQPPAMWCVRYMYLGEQREMFIRARNQDQVMQLYAKKAQPRWFFVSAEKLSKENDQ